MSDRPFVRRGDRIVVLERVIGRRVGMTVRVDSVDRDGNVRFADKGNSYGGRATRWAVAAPGEGAEKARRALERDAADAEARWQEYVAKEEL